MTRTGLIIATIILFGVSAIGFYGGWKLKKCNYADVPPITITIRDTVFLTDSASVKAIYSLQTENKNLSNENYFLSNAFLKLRKQAEIIAGDSVRNMEDYNWVKDYKIENNFK